ncbi:MAG: hypothetical protein ACLGHQ_14435 [Acidimicrobiia bacterium]
MSSRRSPLVLVAVAASTAFGGACTQSDGGTTTGCEATVAAAANAVEIDEQKRLLDEALLQCRSVGDLTRELERNPGLIGYSPETFISLRCTRIDDAATQRGPTCAAVVSPTTTVPPTTVVELVFVGDTLDDRRIEIRPSATTRFVGDVPEVIQQTVDIAFESGCDGLIEQRDVWFARIDGSPAGDEASVYARHAQNVAEYIGCEVPPLPG